MQVTPEKIEYLEPGYFFVFGSNESGAHGGGAAHLAWKQFDAIWGQGFGLAGRTFAIPTLDWDLQKLPEFVIQHYVNRFIDFAKLNPSMHFLVTAIGTGIAGYKIADMALCFKEAWEEDLPNVSLPQSFINYLELIKES